MKKKMAEDISVKVIERLTKYLRCLENLNQDEFISSDDLAGRMGFTPAQIRKDLSNFGDFGVRGKGYQVRTLHSDIERILGVHKTNNIIIIGLGRLGNALFAEPEFTKESFNVVGLFDNSPSKIGTEINGLKIRDTKDIPYFLVPLCAPVVGAALGAFSYRKLIGRHLPCDTCVDEEQESPSSSSTQHKASL